MMGESGRNHNRVKLKIVIGGEREEGVGFFASSEKAAAFKIISAKQMWTV